MTGDPARAQAESSIALGEYPKKLEAYFNDQFGFRKRLIHWLNLVKVTGLRMSPSPKIILGKKGWLIDGYIDLPYFRGAGAAHARAARKLAARLRVERRDWLAARGIPYLVVVSPNKDTIYPEFMPSSYNRVHAQSRLDQFMAHLKAHSNLAIVDLRQPLLKAKSREQVYYRTDTHWNNRGAYVGYAKIIEALSAWYPQLKAFPRSDYREVKYSSWAETSLCCWGCGTTSGTNTSIWNSPIRGLHDRSLIGLRQRPGAFRNQV